MMCASSRSSGQGVDGSRGVEAGTHSGGSAVESQTEEGVTDFLR